MKNKRLVIIIAVLVIVVGFLSYINQKSLANRDQSAENPSITIKLKGEEKGSIALNEIRALGEEEFVATLRSSGKPPSDHTYKGVPLSAVLRAVDAGILENGKQVAIKAIDGYVSAFKIDEVKDEENIFVVYLQDGKALKAKKDGGSGPLMIVVRKDEFGQRWCKFVSEVEIQ